MIVKVVEYNSKWPIDFKNESEKIHDILGVIANHIYHIGSTSVPGLKAKPIIDIMLEVTSFDALDSKAAAFEGLGYEVKGEFGMARRRYFRKGGMHRTHQIHAFESGDSHIIRHLAFRDYLIVNKNIANEYGALKSDLAKTCNNDINRYGDRKDEFVKYHEGKAVAWYGEDLKLKT